MKIATFLFLHVKMLHKVCRKLTYLIEKTFEGVGEGGILSPKTSNASIDRDLVFFVFQELMSRTKISL